jgi:hyperpolarization activated cyclic nucleotide-gated potassium channel 2
MKLFGNKNALIKEKQRQQAVGKCVIHPCSNFRLEYSIAVIGVVFKTVHLLDN